MYAQRVWEPYLLASIYYNIQMPKISFLLSASSEISFIPGRTMESFLLLLNIKFVLFVQSLHNYAPLAFFPKGNTLTSLCALPISL